MDDAMNTLRRLSNANKARDEELRDRFKQLESNLLEASSGLVIRGKSDNCCLERYGDDEAFYGYLFFDSSGLRVAYRSTEDDISDALEDSYGNADPVYSVENLDKCHPVWLRALAASSLIESLMNSIMDAARAVDADNKEALGAFPTMVNFATRSFESGLGNRDKIREGGMGSSSAMRAFIPYSWDSEEHKKWVLNFANKLRQHGIDAFLDQTHLQLGGRSPEFMEKSVRESDKVLVICTEQYKERFDHRRGGAGYEGHIISAEMVNQLGKNKFIPVLRSGDWLTALPTALGGCYGIDLRKDSEEEFRKLVESLHGVSRIIPIGPPPAWLGQTDIPSSSQPLGSSDDEYWAQRKKVPDTEIIKKIWNKPRWRIWVRPKQFRKARFQSVQSCKEFMLSHYVMVTGWFPYPYISADQLEKGDEWIAGEIEHVDNGMTRLERWALFRSAQFVHNRAVDEIKALGTDIHVLEILDTVTAAFEFLARMAERGLLSPGADIRFELYNMDGRALTWRDGPPGLRLRNCWCQVDTITVEKSIVANEVAEQKRILALDVAREIFANFGWENLPEVDLRDAQQKRIGAVN